jgi:hypothetical protein
MPWAGLFVSADTILGIEKQNKAKNIPMINLHMDGRIMDSLERVIHFIC